MSHDVLIVAERPGGVVSDLTVELIDKGRALASGLGGHCAVALLGDHPDASGLEGADVVYRVDDPRLSGYSPEAFELALAAVVQASDPRVVLLGTTTLGIDLAPALSVRLEAPIVSYVVGLELVSDELVATAQIYGGKLMAETVLHGDLVICCVIAGSLGAGDAGTSSDRVPEIIEVEPPADLGSLKATFLALREPERTGIDITAAELLVSVGRGIAGQENLELVQELADALGAPLSASRPIIDQGWLPKAHQVGKSGQKVKPKAYLAFGISGAPEHLEGMRTAEIIIACNTDPNAPIFDVATYGTTLDLFDLVPELTERLAK
jgi:electron transfer flavoprotein alpha subunit